MKSPVRIALALSALLALALPVAAQTPGVVTLTSVKGDVFVSTPTGNMVRAGVGQPVGQSQSIVVGASSSAEAATAAGPVSMTTGTFSVTTGGVITTQAGVSLGSMAVASGPGGATGAASVAAPAAGAAGATAIGTAASVSATMITAMGAGVAGAIAKTIQHNRDNNTASDIDDPTSR